MTGQRLTISYLISRNGFHLRILDIFKCEEVHSMDNNHFVAWMESTSSVFRSEHGRPAKIALIIDNATWHNKLTPESEPHSKKISTLLNPSKRFGRFENSVQITRNA